MAARKDYAAARNKGGGNKGITGKGGTGGRGGGGGRFNFNTPHYNQLGKIRNQLQQLHGTLDTFMQGLPNNTTGTGMTGTGAKTQLRTGNKRQQTGRQQQSATG